MLVVRHHQSVPAAARGAVVAIGNFDGIHRGHQAVIARAQRIAEATDAPAAVMTFEPHPRGFFKPDQPPFRLTPFRVKTRLVEALGVKVMFAQAFNRAFAGLPAEAFVTEVLHRGMGAQHVVVGHNFHFGKGRGGDPAFLKEVAGPLGIGVTVLQPVTSQGGEAYSSTLVRQYLAEGKVTRAALLLGRYWEVEGRVQGGKRLGRTIGFPTANVPLGPVLRPTYGVYAVRAAVESGDGIVWHAGVANIGVRPTVEGGAEPRLEVHLFDFDRDIYGRHLRVALVDFIRPERKFDGLDALKAQIAADADAARRTLEWETWRDSWPASPYLGDPFG